MARCYRSAWCACCKKATVKAFDTRANFTQLPDLDTDTQAFMAEKVTCNALSEDYFDGVDTLVLSPGLL